MSAVGSILIAVSTFAAAASAPAEEALNERPRFQIEVPSNVLTDVPVSRIVIRALDGNGGLDSTYNEQPLITGIRVSLPQSDDARVGPFKNGVLELTTDIRAGRKVYVSAPEIVVDAGARRSARLSVPRTYRWLGLAPAAIALAFCIWPRNFVLAMFLAVLGGMTILSQGDLFRAFVRTVDSLADLSQSTGNSAHVTLIVVLLLAGSLFSVLTQGGGLPGLCDRLSRYAKTRERGQAIVLGFGLLTFFDDVTHALVIGNLLRPLSDRLRISREKLAFLVNTTAAPVAALVVLSTWLGSERGTIRGAFEGLAISGNATTTLVASLPYCFYPVLMLIFATLVVVLGQDFGPMLRAEWRAAEKGELTRPGPGDPAAVSAVIEDNGARRLARNALLPLLLLVGLMAVGLWWTGSRALDATTSGAVTAERTLLNVLEHSNPLRVLLFSLFVASASAVPLAVWSRSLTLSEGLHAWVSGLQQMVPAALLLVLSWSFQKVCDADHLNTAGFLTEFCQPRVTVEWVPLVAFLVVGLTSFLAGSAWAALPAALPAFISVTNALLVDLNESNALHPMLLATIGAVVGGAAFGKHCSPISEISILSSASSACSHIDHVFTQMPYAIAVAAVTTVFGYCAVAYGYSPVVLLPFATGILFAVIQFGGRPVIQREESETPSAAESKEKGAKENQPAKSGAPGDKPAAPNRAA